MNNKFHNVIKHHELKLIAVLCKAYTSRGVVELFAELAVSDSIIHATTATTRLYA